MSHRRLVPVRRRSWIGTIAIGLAAVAGLVPAAFAQDPPDPRQDQSAGAGAEADEFQTNDEMSVELKSAAGEPTGVFVAAPIGKIWVDPEFVDGEPSYVRRTRGKEGMAVVEVSSTPFMPEPSGIAGPISQSPELPASW